MARAVRATDPCRSLLKNSEWDMIALCCFPFLKSGVRMHPGGSRFFSGGWQSRPPSRSEARAALAKALTAGGPQAPLLFLLFLREGSSPAWAGTRSHLGIQRARSAGEAEG